MRLGKYRILCRLAIGGMAEIFLARVEGLHGFEKLVVVKRLLPEHLEDSNRVRMFFDEARLMATLNHPNIAQVNDVGSSRRGYFFVMEYVHGEDLQAILKASMGKGQPVPLAEAVGIIADAASGLHYAHGKRASDGVPLDIVHRDISPSNLLVSYDGALKVTDFGVAKWVRQDSVTRHGTLKGKLGYMSPEQCRGESLDQRSDVFALGILLYELTTGAWLFGGPSDFAILTQIANHDVAPPSARRPGYPAALERIVMRALERDRDQRFSTARQLQLALEAFAHQHQLAIGPAARGRYMQDLFAEKLDAWRAAVAAGRSLGEYLAIQPLKADRTLDVPAHRTAVTSDQRIERQAPARALAGTRLSRVLLASGLVAVAAAYALRRWSSHEPIPTEPTGAVVEVQAVGAPAAPILPVRAPIPSGLPSVATQSPQAQEPLPVASRRSAGLRATRPRSAKRRAEPRVEVRPPRAAPSARPVNEPLDPDSLFLPK